VKFAVNDKAAVIHPEGIQELQDLALSLRGKEIYIGNGTKILKIKKISGLIATIRIEGDFEILEKPGT